MQTTSIEVPNEFVPQVKDFINNLLTNNLVTHSKNKQLDDDSDDLINISFFDEEEWLRNMDNLLETPKADEQPSSLQDMFQSMDKAFETSQVKNEKLIKRDWTREELYRV